MTPPASPFKGLTPFEDSELDAFLFFGREREQEIVVANLLGSRVTVLYGPSGVGKSSLLRAGVAHRLRALARENRERRGRPELAVAVFGTWSGDPVAGLVDAAAEAVAQAAGEPAAAPDPSLPLADALARLADRVGGELYVVLDQFEEFFVYADAPGARRFATEFPEAVADPQVRASFLVAIREDALAKLDAFQGRIPRLFANFLRLDHLDRAAARAAIVGPIGRWNELAGEGPRAAVEPELVEAVLDEVGEGAVELARVGRGSADAGGRERRIEAAYLQLVVQRLWEAEAEAGSRTLRLETLRRLGGAAEIVRAHLELALGALSAEQKDVAAALFEHLVTPSGTKIAQKADDLAQYAAVDEAVLAPVLSTLDRERIVRPVDADGAGGGRYEIFHDVLAEAVLAWRGQRELDRERQAAARRQRRLLALAVAALAALAAVAALAAWALVERGHSQSVARTARAREATARALAELPDDPQRALALALDAARLERTPTTEDVLRRALLASRLLLVLPLASRVTAASFSPDGRRILAAEQDGTARIFAARTGRVVHVFHHGGPVTTASFDPAGRLVVTASADGAGRIFDARSGRLVRILRHPAAVRDAEFGPGGRVAVTASADGQILISSVEGGPPVRILRGGGDVLSAELGVDRSRVAAVVREPSGATRARLFDVAGERLLRVLPARGITGALFSPDGRVLATASADGTIRLWSAASGDAVRVLRGHESRVNDIAFTPDGKLVASASADGSTAVWDVATGVRLLLLLGHSNSVLAVAFSPDGRLVASAGRDWTTLIWNLSHGEQVATLAGHTGAVTGLGFSGDGRRILTASTDGTVRVWDASPAQELRLLDRHPPGETPAAFGASGRVVSAGVDGTTRISSVAPRRVLRTLRDGAPVVAVALSPDGRLVAGGTARGAVRLRGVRSGVTRAALRLGGPIRTLAFSGDGRRLLVVGAREVRLVAVRSGRTLLRLMPPAEVTDAASAADGSLLAVASSDGTVRVWRADRRRPLRTLRGPDGAVVRVRFSPDGSQLATAGASGIARLWQVVSGRLVHELRAHTAALTDVEFSADGQLVVTASADHDARTWDVATGSPLRVLRGHFGAVTQASFSPDGNWVVTAGPTTAGLWETASGRLLFYIRGPTRPPLTASFSPDGRRILATSADGTVRLYDCAVCGPFEELVARAERRLVEPLRALPPAARRRYLPED